MNPTQTEGGRAGLVEALEEGLCAIWVRSRICLGGATLQALFDRVLSDGRRQCPLLGFVEVTCAGVRFHRDREALAAATPEELATAFQLLIRELVGVLGCLSGGVLTTPLRAAVDTISQTRRN